jgi:predicted pyridoxine 5'-phosphate oxidase superfamily flavin-nucleotide-binding protein
MSDSSPFHVGERAVQSRLGVQERVERAGRRLLRSAMPDQHRELFAQLPMLFVASLDEQGQPWASILEGRPGFVSSPDPNTLSVRCRLRKGDPLASNLKVGAPVGSLGIELPTRRRNRANGNIQALGEFGFEIEVRESFGNCPKYIHVRAPRALTQDRAPARVRGEGSHLSRRARELVAAADTFFIATAAPAAATGLPFTTLDISHRGGAPGFVTAADGEGQTVLTFPDFVGNFLFNTIGNLAIEPRAGLLFIDFAQGDVLQLIGVAHVIWEGPAVAAIAGAQRLVHFSVTEGVLHESSLGSRWTGPEVAPELV